MRLALLATLLLAACTGAAPPLGPVVRPVPSGTTEPIRFNTLNMGQMRRGTEIGRYVWNIDCGSPYGRVYWTSGMGFRRENTFRERFAEVFGDAGFDVAGAVYADGADRRRARYMVTGELREVRLELCRQWTWLTGASRGVSGVASIKIDWTVYEPEEQRVVLRTGTTGHAVLNDGVPEGDVLLIEEGFSNAAEALAADPGFRKAVARGGGAAPPAPGAKRWRMVPEHEREPEREPEQYPTPIAAEPVRTAVLPLRAVAALGVAQQGGAGNGVVRVGDGRGVVVGQADGATLLLAPSMAGDTVPVQAGRSRAEGRILARDAALGLMLVRVPARLASPPLRAEAPAVSEPVYATGAGGAAVSGMIAGLTDGVLLADLEGAAPDPGDPLFDDAGQLLALALGGRREAGLARFVPIAAALATLGVAVPPPHVNLDGRGRPPT